MTRLILRLGTLWLALLVVAGVPAQAVDFGLGVRGGTQGLGLEGGITASGFITVRAGLYGGKIGTTYDEAGISYDGDLKVGGGGVLVDFFPTRRKFRISAGLFRNRNEITLDATPTQPQLIGNNPVPYTPAQIGSLSGVVEFNDTAPYLGIGGGNVARGNRVGFLWDVGVLRQGDGKVSLSSSTGIVSQADLDAEARETEAEIDGYDLWPVISFGIAIRL